MGNATSNFPTRKMGCSRSATLSPFHARRASLQRVRKAGKRHEKVWRSRALQFQRQIDASIRGRGEQFHGFVWAQ